MTPIILRPDQAALKQAIYNEWNAGAQNVLAVLPTGGGKSIISSDIILDGHRDGLTEVIMAHRNELVGQMSLHVARRGIQHRIIGSSSTISGVIQEHRAELGRSFVNPDAKCSVGSVQTIVSRLDQLKQWGAQVDRWTMDECFPAGTMIDTPDGQRTIESIQVGDIVTAWNEQTGEFVHRRVNHLFRNPTPKNMVRIDSGGHHVVATINHPFWTSRGWVVAGDLEPTDDLLVDMCAVQNGFHDGKRICQLSGEETRSSLLLAEVRICTSRQGTVWRAKAIARKGAQADTSAKSRKGEAAESLSDLFGGAYSHSRQDVLKRVHVCNYVANNGSHEPQVRFGANAEPQSNEARRCQSQGFKLAASDKSQARAAGWEWQGSAESRASIDADVVTVRLCPSAPDQNWTKGAWLPDMLQARCSASDPQSGDRGRWSVTSSVGPTRAGREKRHVFAMQRVDRVEIYESGNSGESCDGFVYNFEVDQLHTYVANGIVVHNCHHLLAGNQWGKAVSLFTNARGLGVTACPQRADGKGLGRHHDGLMDVMVTGPTMRQLIDMVPPALSDYQVVIPQTDFEIGDDAITQGGDYSPKKMKDASKRSHIVSDAVTEYLKWTPGKKAICFATDIETANDIAARFNAVGIAAAALSSLTDAGVRREMVRRFRDGRLLVLVNVDLFDEGFDVSDCEVVIMCRPTASLNKFLQMLGRGLRTALNKAFGWIIDLVSNVLRHGLPDRPRVWTLDRRDKRAKKAPDPDEIPLTACRECSRPYERCLPRCPYCGAEPVVIPGSRTPEQVDGDLVLLDRETLAQMRAAMTLEAPADIGARVAYAAGEIAGRGAVNRQMDRIGSQNDLKAAIEQWAGIRLHGGDEERTVHKRFYLTTGMTVQQAMALSRSEMDTMADMVRGWYGA